MSLNKDAVKGEAPKDTKSVDVQALMKSDPRFIARLIQQLDSQMHCMQDEKKRRQQAIQEDTEELQRIDKDISTHIQPGMVELLMLDSHYPHAEHQTEAAKATYG